EGLYCLSLFCSSSCSESSSSSSSPSSSSLVVKTSETCEVGISSGISFSSNDSDFVKYCCIVVKSVFGTLQQINIVKMIYIQVSKLESILNQYQQSFSSQYKV